MGLDMYLSRTKTMGYSIPQIRLAESYLGLEQFLSANPDKHYTLKEWNGKEDADVDHELVEKIRPMMGRYGISEDVGYWRKANAVHNWFVTHIQDGNDDCGEYIVSKEDIESLLDTCEQVLASSKLVKGTVNNGFTVDKNGKYTPITEEGETVDDASVADELLPTCSGFFFGSTDYDSYYIADIKNTASICRKVLDTTNWDEEVITYQSSW